MKWERIKSLHGTKDLHSPLTTCERSSSASICLFVLPASSHFLTPLMMLWATCIKPCTVFVITESKSCFPCFFYNHTLIQRVAHLTRELSVVFVNNTLFSETINFRLCLNRSHLRFSVFDSVCPLTYTVCDDENLNIAIFSLGSFDSRVFVSLWVSLIVLYLQTLFYIAIWHILTIISGIAILGRTYHSISSEDYFAWFYLSSISQCPTCRSVDCSRSTAAGYLQLLHICARPHFAAFHFRCLCLFSSFLLCHSKQRDEKLWFR